MEETKVVLDALVRLRKHYVENCKGIPGLCNAARVMRKGELLSEREYLGIKGYMHRWMRERDIRGYIWPPFAVQERVLWLDEQITKLKYEN